MEQSGDDIQVLVSLFKTTFFQNKQKLIIANYYLYRMNKVATEAIAGYTPAVYESLAWKTTIVQARLTTIDQFTIIHTV